MLRARAGERFIDSCRDARGGKRGWGARPSVGVGSELPAPQQERSFARRPALPQALPELDDALVVRGAARHVEQACGAHEAADLAELLVDAQRAHVFALSGAGELVAGDPAAKLLSCVGLRHHSDGTTRLPAHSFTRVSVNVSSRVVRSSVDAGEGCLRRFRPQRAGPQGTREPREVCARSVLLHRIDEWRPGESTRPY